MQTGQRVSVVALLLIAFGFGVNAATTIRLCVPDNLNASRLDACNKLMQQASTNDVTFTCYNGGTTTDVRLWRAYRGWRMCFGRRGQTICDPIDCGARQTIHSVSRPCRKARPTSSTSTAATCTPASTAGTCAPSPLKTTAAAWPTASTMASPSCPSRFATEAATRPWLISRANVPA